MNIKNALSCGKEILGKSFEAEILLAFLLKQPHEYIFAHPEAFVSVGIVRRFQAILRRRAQGIPLAYLTHHKEFFGLDFYVDERVLIPRPETEMLIEEAINRLQIMALRAQQRAERSNLHQQLQYSGASHHHSRLSICDVGTGSGCIAVALAKSLPGARVVAVDISEPALEVAKKNAKTHAVEMRIEFLKSDLLGAVSDCSFDAVIANLPYIGESEYHFVEKSVAKYEPHRALFAGEKGLDLFKKLFAQLAAMKKAGNAPKWLIAEIGFMQRKPLARLIRKYFGAKIYEHTEWKKDLAGLDRGVVVNFKF